MKKCFLIITTVLLIIILSTCTFYIGRSWFNDDNDYLEDQYEYLDKEIIYDNELHVYQTKELASANHGYYTINDALSNASSNTTIFVHEGIYREELIISKKDNISIVAYENESVYITATEEINNFSKYNDNGIYVADVMDIETNYTQLITNGIKNEMAKFPNKTIESNMEVFEDGGGYSYLTDIYKNAGEPGYVTFDENVPDVDLTGGIFKGFIGKNRQYPVGTIVSNDKNKIGFNSITNNEWQTVVEPTDHLFGFGYIYHKNLIDIEGEWFLEGNKLYYMPPKDENINDLLIEMQVREKVLTINNSNNIEINNIHFYGGTSEIKKTNEFIMRNSSMQYLSGFYMKAGYGDYDSCFTGIYIENCDNLYFRSNYIGRTYGNGFYLKDVDNSIFSNCIMEDIGSSGIFTSGIYTNGGNLIVNKCTFNENGRFQIRVRGEGKYIITDNVFSSSMMLGEDAGPLEFTSTGSVYPYDLQESIIAYNIINDVRGIPVSGSNGYLKQFVKAFYMEDVENYTAHHNLIYDIKAKNSLHMLEDFPKLILESGLIYLGPRFNELTKPINYYNNTAYDYDTNISIWHIEINNYKELELDHTGGSLLDGSFINNALEEVSFSIGYNTKNIDITGGFIGGNLTNENGFASSYKSFSFDDFASKLDTINYYLNPQNNILLKEEEKSSQYIDAKTGDFRLGDNSILKNNGISIKGITQEGDKTPDVGALEGSSRVLYAGSNVKAKSLHK